jgi:hypothetical protein
MIDTKEFLLVECGTGSLGRNLAKLLPVLHNSLAVTCIINFSLFLELKLHNFFAQGKSSNILGGQVLGKFLTREGKGRNHHHHPRSAPCALALLAGICDTIG